MRRMDSWGYYDFPNDIDTPGLEAVDDWVVFRKAASVHLHQPPRTGPMSCVGRSRLNAPFPHCLFVGDYMGLATRQPQCLGGIRRGGGSQPHRRVRSPHRAPRTGASNR
jgi:hypothetical protein